MQSINNLVAQIMIDSGNLTNEVKEQQRLCNLTRHEYEVDKAKLYALAGEKRHLEVRVERLEGNISSLQGEAVAQDNEVIRI